MREKEEFEIKEKIKDSLNVWIWNSGAWKDTLDVDFKIPKGYQLEQVYYRKFNKIEITFRKRDK